MARDCVPNSRALVCESVVYLAPPSAFKDKEDAQPQVPTLDEAFDLQNNLLGKLVSEVGSESKAVLGRFNRFFTDKALGVCSLTDDPLNEAMWTEYADNHGGMCVELDLRALSRFVHDNLRIGFFLEPVQYLDKLEPTFNPFKKLRVFSFEREWRLLRDYDILEWTSPPDRRLSLPPGVVVGVMVGKRADAESKRLVREWCQRGCLPPPTELSESRAGI